MVELHEGVDEQLPVGPDLGAELVHLGHLAEGVLLDPGAESTHVLLQRFGIVVEVDEHEAGPHLAAHRHQAEVGEVEVEELRLLLYEVERSVEVVAPPVVLARELAADTAGLLGRVVLPDEFVATVPADVVESPRLVTAVVDDDDRGAG